MIKTDRKILLALLYVKDLFAYSCSYLQSWGDHSMHRNVLPWYPGGHALSKMHGRHLYLQHRHGEGSHKEKLTKQGRQQTSQRVQQETGTEGEFRTKTPSHKDQKRQKNWSLSTPKNTSKEL